jgi:hypothetical protein
MRPQNWRKKSLTVRFANQQAKGASLRKLFRFALVVLMKIVRSEAS